MDDDISVFEKYKLAEQFRDPAKRYAPDKEDGGPKLDKGDKDKDKKKKDKPNITEKRVLVRNPDGTIGVQFIDVKTGRVIQNPFGDRKKEISAGDFDDVFGKKRKSKSDKTDGDQKYNPELNPGFIGYDKNGNAMFNPDTYVDPRGSDQFSSRSARPSDSGGFANQPSSSKSSKSGVPARAQDDVEEQGDKDGNIPTSKVSASEDYGIYDPSTTQGTVGYQNMKDMAALNAKENAGFTSLDDDGFDTYNGNNSHPLEGVNLNDSKSIVASRDWDQATIDKAARTLAGELPGDVDLSTPEGQREARAVLSTIENRDIANGPNETAMDAITAPSQYSTWNNDEGAKVANANYSLRADEFNKAVTDYLADPNSNLGFTSYHAPYVNPAWSDDMQDVETIGGHKFGTLPEYTSKMTKYQAPISDEQKNAVATDIVNQNFQQSFAAPVGEYISQNTPAIDTTGVQTSPSLDSFAQGITAQRDYLAPQRIQQIKEDLTVQGPLSTIAANNPTQAINNQVNQFNQDMINQGNQIANTAPTIDTPAVEVATRSLPTITGVEDGFSTAPSIPAQDFNDRMMTPQANTDVAMGFGDFVNTTNANTIDPQQVGVNQTNRINGLFENENVGMLNSANDIANNAPSIAAESNAMDSLGITGDPTSAGQGPDAQSVDTGVSSGSVGGFATADSHDSSTSSSTDSGGSMGTSPGDGGLSGTDTDTNTGETDGFL